MHDEIIKDMGIFQQSKILMTSCGKSRLAAEGGGGRLTSLLARGRRAQAAGVRARAQRHDDGQPARLEAQDQAQRVVELRGRCGERAAGPARSARRPRRRRRSSSSRRRSSRTRPRRRGSTSSRSRCSCRRSARATVSSVVSVRKGMPGSKSPPRSRSAAPQHRRGDDMAKDPWISLTEVRGARGLPSPPPPPPHPPAPPALAHFDSPHVAFAGARSASPPHRCASASRDGGELRESCKLLGFEIVGELMEHNFLVRDKLRVDQAARARDLAAPAIAARAAPVRVRPAGPPSSTCRRSRRSRARSSTLSGEVARATATTSRTRPGEAQRRRARRVEGHGQVLPRRAEQLLDHGGRARRSGGRRTLLNTASSSRLYRTSRRTVMPRLIQRDVGAAHLDHPTPFGPPAHGRSLRRRARWSTARASRPSRQLAHRRKGAGATGACPRIVSAQCSPGGRGRRGRAAAAARRAWRHPALRAACRRGCARARAVLDASCRAARAAIAVGALAAISSAPRRAR